MRVLKEKLFSMCNYIEGGYKFEQQIRKAKRVCLLYSVMPAAEQASPCVSVIYETNIEKFPKISAHFFT